MLLADRLNWHNNYRMCGSQTPYNMIGSVRDPPEINGLSAMWSSLLVRELSQDMLLQYILQHVDQT